MTSRRTYDAIHESGHAVVGIVLGARVNSVDIQHLEGRAGLCRVCMCKVVDGKVIDLDIVHNIAIDLAGGMAEHEHQLRRGEKYNPGCCGDMADVDKTLRKLYGNKFTSRARCREFHRGEALAKEIIGSHWGAIVHLANWLLKNEVASGRLAHAIVVSYRLAAKESGVEFNTELCHAD